jgi:ketosteroid isomerase-like protein
MMSSGHRHRLYLCFLSCAAGACSAPKADPRAAAKDPGAPAVVQAPQVIVPADTIGKPRPQSAATLQDARRTVSGNFAVLGAAITYGDLRMLATLFAPDAEVITPDTTYKGIPAIVNGFGRLAAGKSLLGFERTSLTAKMVDSTVFDSGVYVVKARRTGADSLLEKGRYATVWRIMPPPRDWVITRDHLYRDRGKKTK